MRRDLESVSNTQWFRKNLGNRYTTARAYIEGEGEPVFEDLLEIYANVYDVEGLRDWLRSFIPSRGRGLDRPFLPSLSHEIASHLAATGLLRYFISLNFDEILEETLADDVGPEWTRVVASRSEFGRLQDLQRDKWAEEYGRPAPKCFVQKPHGTISRDLTLHHLPNRVQKFERQVKEVLRNAMQDALVVLIGFGSYNEDFRLLFLEEFSQSRTGDVVVVDVEPTEVVERLPPPGIRKILQFKGTADTFFDRLGDALCERSVEMPGLVRQKPTRHRIRSLFFDLFSRSLVKTQDEASYFKENRALAAVSPEWLNMRKYELELLIFLMKTRGLFVDLATSDCPRIERAYRQCLLDLSRSQNSRQEKWFSISPGDVLKSILDPNGENLFSLRRVYSAATGSPTLNTNWCFLLAERMDVKNQSFESQKGSFEHEFDLSSTNQVEDTNEGTGPPPPSSTSKSVARAYNRWLDGQCEKIKWKPKRFIDEKRLAELLDTLWQDFDVDISDTDLTNAMRFQAPIPLDNRSMLGEYSRVLLKEPEWKKLQLASVSAEWLTRELLGLSSGEEHCRELEVVSNLDMFKLPPSSEPDTSVPELAMHELFHYQQMVKKMAKMFTRLGPCRINKVIWYARRNLQHHMTIVLDQDDNPKRANYFRRSGRSTGISPVHLCCEEDLSALTEFFTTLKGEEDHWLTDEDDAGQLFKVQVEDDGNLMAEFSSCEVGRTLACVLRSCLDI